MLKIYSKSIEVFLKRVTVYAKEILENEFKVRVARSRFHLFNGWNYPLVIVAIDDPKVLGCFDHNSLTIAINKRLMYEAKTTVLKNILRHELVHYFVLIENDQYTREFFSPHGHEFKLICERCGYGEEVSSATTDLCRENEALIGDLQTEKLISKVQKLLSLAKSDNQNEAELATVRANQIITQYNLDQIALTAGNSSGISDDIEYVTKLVLPGGRWTPRMSAISSILHEFFVYPVKGSHGLEITGTRSNVENGEYIANYLDLELEKIWKHNKRGNPLILEKPFMVSLSRSYIGKLRSAKKTMPLKDQNALVVLSKELDWAADGIYGGLRSSSSKSYTSCDYSAALGSLAGRNLEINRGVSGGTAAMLLE